MNQTLIYPIRGKHQPKEDPWAKSPLAGPSASRVSMSAHSPVFIRGLPRRVSEHHRLARDRLGGKFPVSPEAPKRGLGRRKFSASPDPSLWCCFPIGALETPYDVTHVLEPTSRTSQDGQGSNHDVAPITAAADHCTSHAVTVHTI
jgi:hypothetical protein